MHGFVGLCGCVLWVLVALGVLRWVLVRLCWLGGGRCVGFLLYCWLVICLLVQVLVLAFAGMFVVLSFLRGVCLRVVFVCIDCCVYCCLGWSVLFTCVCFGLVGLC